MKKLSITISRVSFLLFILFSCDGKTKIKFATIADSLFIEKIDSKIIVEKSKINPDIKSYFVEYRVKLTYKSGYYTELPWVKILEIDTATKVEKDITHLYLSYIYPGPGAAWMKLNRLHVSDSTNKSTLKELTFILLDSFNYAGKSIKVDTLCFKTQMSILNFFPSSDTVTFSINITPLQLFATDKRFSSISNDPKNRLFKIIFMPPVYLIGHSIGFENELCVPKFMLQKRFKDFSYLPFSEFKYDTLIVTNNQLSLLQQN